MQATSPPCPVASLDALLARPGPVLALAPMQDITDLPFWRILARHGGPDVYWTEYSRVHATSSIERSVAEAIQNNPTGKPAIAQLIGNDPKALARAARELQQMPVAAIDLNLGCPAPVVYRKCAGGGLLREPQRIELILGALRDAIDRVRFTVKTRVGFDHPGDWEALLSLFAKHPIDLLTVHGRTVADMYRTEVRHDLIRMAVERMPCPVLANGNVASPARALDVLSWTGARGLMVGRGCIRNPWIFSQVRDACAGRQPRLPSGRDMLAYVTSLYEETAPHAGFRERLQVEKLKKYMNFVGEGMEPPGPFLHQIRRVETRADFFAVCREFMDHDRPMTLAPESQRPAATPPG